MRIANPIYDAVFKYLLTNDIKVAKLILSNLMGEEIIDLQLMPTELVSAKSENKPEIGTKESYTVMRMDFAAKIQNEDGSQKMVLIELQKAKLLTDIMRFRRYLGAQYMKKEHTYELNGQSHALPIFPIYILGHKLDGYDEEAIYIEHNLINAVTYERIKKTEDGPFVDSLFHKGLIIQIPCVKREMKEQTGRKINKHLAELLLIFEQNNFAEGDEHFLEIDQEQLPSWLSPILRTLEKAGEDKDVRERMELEDDYIADLEDLERQIENAKKQAEENRERAKKAEKQVEEEKKRAEEAKKQVEEEKKRAEEAEMKLEKMIKHLVSTGMPEEAAKKIVEDF